MALTEIQVKNAKAPEGKAASSRNAFKGGWRTALRDMAAQLRAQKDGLKRV